jgi:hypothetical protein
LSHGLSQLPRLVCGAPVRYRPTMREVRETPIGFRRPGRCRTYPTGTWRGTNKGRDLQLN